MLQTRTQRWFVKSAPGRRKLEPKQGLEPSPKQVPEQLIWDFDRLEVIFEGLAKVATGNILEKLTQSNKPQPYDDASEARPRPWYQIGFMI